jgi:predicted negative regulator of RcsB-dependent stress response
VEDLSDIERAEQVRRFVRENLLVALLALAVGIGGVAGYKYWQAKRTGGAEQAETEYETVIAALSSGDRERARQLSAELRANHAGSPYADQADLAIAKLSVARRDYDDAAKVLRGVMDGAKDPLLRRVARLRLARVLSEQGKHDEALALLTPGEAGGFAALYHDVRGDAYAAKGDFAAARAEYSAALTADETTPTLDGAYVALKRDALPATAAPAGAASGAPATEAEAGPAKAPAATAPEPQS